MMKNFRIFLVACSLVVASNVNAQEKKEEETKSEAPQEQPVPQKPLSREEINRHKKTVRFQASTIEMKEEKSISTMPEEKVKQD